MTRKNEELWPRKVNRAFQAQIEKSLWHLLRDIISFARAQSRKTDTEFWAELRFRLKEKIDALVDKAQQDVTSPKKKKEAALV